jgi:preprotein translocase subunit SecA
MRKNVLKYDDVMNKQRTVIYAQRRQVLEGQDLSEQVRSWIGEVVERAVDAFVDRETQEIDLESLVGAMQALYGTDVTPDELREDSVTTREALIEDFTEDASERYEEKERELGPELMRELERFVLLQVVDTRWREHLENMEYMREGVHLRAMAQKDPLVEYTREGEQMFRELGDAIREEVVLTLFHAELQPEEAGQLQEHQEAQQGNGSLSYEHQSLAGADVIAGAFGGDELVEVAPRPQQRVVAEAEKLGRNDPCWCGSGKKFKRCHGA